MIQTKATDAVVELAQSFRDSYQTVADTAVAAQEHNVKFAQTVFGTGVEEFKNQFETSRAMFATLAQQSERQQQAVESLAREAVTAYIEFLYSPVSYYQKGIEAAQFMFRQFTQQPGI